MTMSLLRFTELIDAYGADSERWPVEDRMAASELLARSSEAQALARRAAVLDDLLEATPLVLPTSSETAVLASRVLAQLPAVRPAPAVRFGWGNWATLAAAGVAGLMIGWSGLTIGPGQAAADTADPLVATATLEDAPW